MANKYVKGCPTPLITREMEVKTSMRYYVASVRMTIKKPKATKRRGGCREIATCTHGSCKTARPLCKTAWGFRKRIKLEPPNDPATPCLRIYPKELKPGCRKERAALPCSRQHPSQGPIQKPPPHPSTEKRHLHTTECYSASKKKEGL